RQEMTGQGIVEHGQGIIEQPHQAVRTSDRLLAVQDGNAFLDRPHRTALRAMERALIALRHLIELTAAGRAYQERQIGGSPHVALAWLSRRAPGTWDHPCVWCILAPARSSRDAAALSNLGRLRIRALLGCGQRLRVRLFVCHGVVPLAFECSECESRLSDVVSPADAVEHGAVGDAPADARQQDTIPGL